MALLCAMWAVTRLEVIAGPEIKIVSPRPESGDEPQYLLVLDAILFYHQLELGDAYAHNPAGYYLGDHHFIFVNRRTGRHASYFARDPEFAAPSPDVYEVSAHPMAYPALLAAFLAPFRPQLRDFARDASLVMVLISWSGALVTYLVARKIGMGRGLALLAASVLSLASPWLAYSRSFYSEPAIGLSLALALLALESGRPKVAALAAGAAAVFKPPFALAGAGLVMERMWARRWGEAAEMLAVLAACATALVSFNYWLARTAVISGNLGLVPVRSFQPLFEALLGPSHGLLNFAPWTIVALISLGLALLPWGGESSVLRPIAVPTALYMVLLSLDSFGPGTCYGPRYWVPFLPWLAIASVEGLRSIRRPWPIHYALLLSYVPAVVLGAAIAIPGALRYWQLFERPASAAWHNLSGTHETRSAGLSGKAGSVPENQRKDTTTMMKDTRPAARNYAPPESAENTVGGASVGSFAQAPLAKATTSLTLDSSKAKPDQLGIADVMSYSGAKPNIAAPAGWTLIRDDSSPSTRQSLYWHVIRANDPSPTWTFSEPVDAQGAILLLDNVAASNPVDAS
ncbi:MAG: hypothetical protein ABSD31_18675, partial [Candidatus Binataceae bacterium]